MKIEDLIDRTEIFLPQYKSHLKDLLKSFPENAEKWFYSSNSPENLYQGDLVENLPVVSLNENAKPVGGYSTVMLLSNTCDMFKSETRYIIVAQVRSFDAYSQKKPGYIEQDAWRSHLLSIQKNQITRFLYMPNYSKLPPSLVDFERICTISKKFILQSSQQNRIASLSQRGYYLFALKLSYHLVRSEAHDVNR
jgi:hypothetical protein